MSAVFDSDEEWKERKMKVKQTQSPSKQDQKTPKYSQRFCEKWLTIFNPWLARCDDDANKPFCRACQCRLDCNRCHLQRHERTKKHARNLEVLISKGEGAARQNLSIRQERSKYYHQRKKLHSLASSHEDAEMVDSNDYIEENEADGETTFQFVQTEAAPGDQYTEENAMKQEAGSNDGHEPLPLPRSPPKNFSGGIKKSGAKKDRMKLYMQIQKDKNDLMDSFKEIMGGNSYNQQLSPPKEKNHVDLFFESVSSSIKALSPKLISEAKMRVSQLVCELELRALTENDVNNSGGVGGGASAVVVSTEAGASVGNAYIINQPVATMVHGQQHYETLS